MEGQVPELLALILSIVGVFLTLMVTIVGFILKAILNGVNQLQIGVAELSTGSVAREKRIDKIDSEILFIKNEQAVSRSKIHKLNNDLTKIVLKQQLEESKRD